MVIERDARHGTIVRRQRDSWLCVAVDRRRKRYDASLNHRNGARATGKRAEKAPAIPGGLNMIAAYDICYARIRLQTAAPSLVSAVYRRLSGNVKDTTHD